jgi:hypothetical protein
LPSVDVNAVEATRYRPLACNVCFVLRATASVKQFAGLDWPDVRRLQRQQSDSRSVTVNEFDLIRLAVAVNVNHGANVPRVQTVGGSVMIEDHD